MDTLTVVTSDMGDMGSYTVTLLITLDNYPSITSTEQFVLTIDACQVSAFGITSVAAQTYTVYTPSIDFSWTDFDASPCPYTLDYSYSLKNTITGTTVAIPGPTMLTQSNSDKTFTVYSTDTSDVGTYELTITGTTPSGTMSPSFSQDLIIDLTVDNNCANDVVTPLSTIPDTQYIIGVDGSI